MTMRFLITLFFSAALLVAVQAICGIDKSMASDEAGLVSFDSQNRGAVLSTDADDGGVALPPAVVALPQVALAASRDGFIQTRAAVHPSALLAASSPRAPPHSSSV